MSRKTFRDRHPDKAVREAVETKSLDRRYTYKIIDGELCRLDTSVVGQCSGCSCDCSDGYPCGHGAAGCRECGYTGKRVMDMFLPLWCWTEQP